MTESTNGKRPRSGTSAPSPRDSVLVPDATSHTAPSGASGGPEPILKADNIDFSYGSLQILFDVSIEVSAGARVALLGTNGAGKSTLLKVLAGLVPAARGTIWFKGQDITKLAAEDRVQLGMTLVEGGKAMFPSLSVLDNLRLGAFPVMKKRQLQSERLEEALEVFPQLHALLLRSAGTLSGGEQQMVAVARAIVSRPELLIIDELSLGLAPVAMQQLAQAIERWIAAGRTLLLVEQSLNVALGLTERAYFMEKGEVQFSGPTTDLLDCGDLVRSVFFGRREDSAVVEG